MPTTGPMKKLLKRHKVFLEMMTYCRPEDSDEEMMFLEKFIYCLPGAEHDDYGNIHVEILRQDGTRPKTLFSSHTDTVHRKGGMQKVMLDQNLGHVFLDPEYAVSGNCLGADDGAGCWLMREMILAKKPGYYVFHRAEEVGGQGSAWLADNQPELLKSFDRAIAFDRKGTEDIINFQSGRVCASNEATQGIADAMAANGIKGMKAANGTFTDTANYSHLIPECFNLSCGYYMQHGPREAQDLTFLEMMRNAVLRIDWDSLPTARTPVSKTSYKSIQGYGKNLYADKAWWQDALDDWEWKDQTVKKAAPAGTSPDEENDPTDDDFDFVTPEDLMWFVMKRPYAAMKALEEAGYTYEDIQRFSHQAKQHIKDWM